LIEALGGRVAACSVVIELGFLKGRKRIHGHELQTLVNFD
jgi:adenine/guanine phosphoribosyltransferase-like PRPP-binding protein